MSTIKHRFLDHQINPETEILILGTFNPDTKKNEADFFYGRSRNHLWRLLPTAFNKPDLKKLSKQEKLSFIKQNRIDFIDLISELEVEDGQEANYDDKFIDSRVTKWRDVIIEIQKLKKLRKIVFTRNSFGGIPNIKIHKEMIQDYCFKNGIFFKDLHSPSRFHNERKQIEWTNFLTNG